MLFDTEREKQLDMGPKWPYQPLKTGECIVSDTMVEDGFQIGDSLNISLQYSKTLRSIIQNNYNPIAL